MVKKVDEKIFVHGLWVDAESFKPHAIEECEIDRIIDLLLAAARNCHKTDDLKMQVKTEAKKTDTRFRYRSIMMQSISCFKAQSDPSFDSFGLR